MKPIKETKKSEPQDLSNGYEKLSKEFIRNREDSKTGIGSESVRNWARSLEPYSTVLDIGCGTGIPISKVLMEEGLMVYGLDASPSMVTIFKEKFPNNPVVCEAVQNSDFFNRQFDGIIVWGLIFLLPGEMQNEVIQRISKSLKIGGKLLFTAPEQICEWDDILTGRPSLSLGEKGYKEILKKSGLKLIEEFEDEGENHYFNSVKIS